MVNYYNKYYTEKIKLMICIVEGLRFRSRASKYTIQSTVISSIKIL